MVIQTIVRTKVTGKTVYLPNKIIGDSNLRQLRNYTNVFVSTVQK